MQPTSQQDKGTALSALSTEGQAKSAIMEEKRRGVREQEGAEDERLMEDSRRVSTRACWHLARAMDDYSSTTILAMER